MQDLVTNLKTTFAEIKAGNDINKAALTELYKQFAEATVRHFMTDFNKTPDLGMIKRKAADIGAAAVIKAVHIAADKIIPNLTKDESSGSWLSITILFPSRLNPPLSKA